MKLLPRAGSLSLRTTVTLSFASLALIVSAILAGGTYLAARGFLIVQREQTAAQQAFASASVVRDGLLTRGSDVIEVLSSLPTSSGSVVLVRRDEHWYSSSLNVAEDAIPADVREVHRAAADLPERAAPIARPEASRPTCNMPSRPLA